MIETPTYIRYKNSFKLFIFRMLDMTRMAPAAELQSVICEEVKFLYHLICILEFQDNKNTQIDALISWCVNLGTDIKLDIVKDMYMEKLKQLNLQDLDPVKYNFSFPVIWDSIHYMCLLADEIVLYRKNYDIDLVIKTIDNFKWVFYNVFIILFCPTCSRHYLTVDNFPYEFEKVQVALYKEKMGEELILVEEETRNMSIKNYLLTNQLLYKSMLFHNHVTNYKPIQHKNDELLNLPKMEWSIYKKLLAIN
uniref:PlxyGVORF76 protein n=1 Tax=Plutella xylostella granulovirus TaxID=98383 RepID=A0A1B2CSG9_9BBAC|nr:PlxyGVORF76 protein [Plutella xylostella granulovirus]